MPRPIPDDVENVTGFIWYLIPVPDDPVFVQAAWDAFSELTYPWNWGKEGRVPDSDIAAQLWSDAIYEALRVRDMGFPDDVLTYIDEVEGLLRTIRDISGCCVGQDATDGDIFTDRVEDGVGDVPQNIIDAGYATGVSDWSGFADYKCMIANALLDTAKWRLSELVGLADEEASSIVGGIGAITAIIGTVIAIAASGPLALVAGMAAAVGAAAKLYEELFKVGVTATNQVIADLETYRDAITCAIQEADGDQAALAAFYAAVDEYVGVDGGVLVRTLNLGPALKALYAGRYDQTDVAQQLADLGFQVGSYSCDCITVSAVDGTRESSVPAVIVSELKTNGDEFHQVDVRWLDAATQNLQDVTFTSIDAEGASNDDTGGTYRVITAAGTTVHDSDSLPTFPIDGARIIVVDQRVSGTNAVQFTATINWQV